MITGPEKRGGMPEEARLDPGVAPGTWERVVRRIVSAAGPELARRRREVLARDGGLLLYRWARPLLAAAAVLILLAGGELALNTVRGTGRPSATSSGSVALANVPGLEDALFPPVVARWIGSNGTIQPTVEEMAFAQLDGGSSR